MQHPSFGAPPEISILLPPLLSCVTLGSLPDNCELKYLIIKGMLKIIVIMIIKAMHGTVVKITSVNMCKSVCNTARNTG